MHAKCFPKSHLCRRKRSEETYLSAIKEGVQIEEYVVDMTPSKYLLVEVEEKYIIATIPAGRLHVLKRRKADLQELMRIPHKEKTLKANKFTLTI